MELRTHSTVLVTGATGMLGSSLCEALTPLTHVVAASQHGRHGTIALDIRDQRRTRQLILEQRPAAVFHLAAITDPEYCDQHRDEATAVNVGGTSHIADVCNEHGIPLVYIGSSGIFDGTKNSYSENDVPSPITVYGRTKYEAERIVQSLPAWYIIRSGWLVGGGPAHDYQFVGMILRQIFSGQTTLHAVTDRVGTITYIPDFITLVLSILATHPFGIYHGTLSGICTRYDIAESILSALGRRLDLHAVDSTFFQNQFFVVRPRSEALHSVKLPPQRPWQEAIKEYCARWV